MNVLRSLLTPLIAFSATLLISQPLTQAAPDYQVTDPSAPAKLRVTGEVINPGLEEFTGTTNASIGESFLRVGALGFEPVEFRNKLSVIEDAENSIIADKISLTHYDSYAEGHLDGAEVLVFRITNGKMELVRRDKVAEGGHKASSWSSSFPRQDKLIAPDVTKFTGGFESWGRPGVPYWFAVVGVDAQGRQGALSEPVRIDRPARPEGQKASESDPGTVKLERPKKGADTTSLADIPAPANFKGKFDPALDQMVFTWDAVSAPDLAGYRIVRSDYDPAKHQGYRLDLAGKAAGPEQFIKKGDMIIVRKPMLETSRSKHLTNRIFDAKGHEGLLPTGVKFHPDENPQLTWSLVKHSADTPVENPGQTFLRLDIKDTKEFAIDAYAYGPTSQDWWPQFKPDRDYVVELWARSERSPVKGRFELDGYYSPNGPNPVPAADFEITDKWQKFTHTIRVPSLYTDGPICQYKLAFQGPAVVNLDNFSIRQADTALGDLKAEDLEMYRKANLGALRTHNFIKTMRNTYSMDQLTNGVGAISSNQGNTLGQTLSVIEKIGTNPWLQVEFHMSPEEWLGFVEFLAAPYDPAKGDTPATKPWAAKRFAQGRTAPWTDAFDKIYLELSNETWNGLFAPWTFQNMPDHGKGTDIDRGTAYGLFQEWFIDQLKASPYWAQAGLDDKVEFVIGGWATQADANGYGQRAIAASPRSKHHTIAAYNGGWYEGEGPMTNTDASLQRILLHAPQVGEVRSNTFANFLAAEKKAGRGNWVNGVYEAGPGYALSGLNNQAEMSKEEVETQAQAMKSLASGTATLDSFLEKAKHGFVLNNFFTVARGRSHWVSHTDLKNGGHAHLPFATIELFNNEGTGDMLKVETLSGPTIDAPGYKKRPAGNQLPLVTAYATRTGDRVNLFVLSRRLDKFPDPAHDGFTPVEIELPFASAEKVTLHRLTGDPRAHNLDSEAVKIENVPLAGPFAAPSGTPSLAFPVDETTGADKRGLPPGSTFLYVFEGVK